MAEELQVRELVSKGAFRKAFSRIYDLFVRRKEGYDLSKNDFTDTYRTKLDALENYQLLPATSRELGGVMVGNGLDIDTKGKLSVVFPDLSRYVTFRDLKKDSTETELRFTKIENAAKQKQDDDAVLDAAVAKRLGLCESKITETKKEADENLKRFENYLTLSEHDAAVAELRGELTTKADIDTVNEVLKKKVTKDKLDGSLVNLLDTIRSEQEKASKDRESIRAVKSDIASLNNLRNLVQGNSQDINHIMQDMQKYLTSEDIKDFVTAEPGKGLSERSFTNADWDRLQSLHNYTLPPATALSLGGVKAGENVEITKDGTINITVPTVKDFIKTADSQRITNALDERITDCEANAKQQTNTLHTLSTSLSTEQEKVASLEKTIKSHDSALTTFATVEDVMKSISDLDKSKVSNEEFAQHTAAKLGLDKLTDDVKNKINSTVTMAVSIDTLQRTLQEAKEKTTRNTDRITRLNSLVAAIRSDIPDSKTYVRAQTGKTLSSNDFSDVWKDKLSVALTDKDIDTRLVGLDANNKIPTEYLPDEERYIQYVDDVTQIGTAREDVLYFNHADKKLYYYDGVNFHTPHDNFYNEAGVDLRTEMADLYVRKSVVEQNTKDISMLQDSITNMTEMTEMYAKKAVTKQLENDVEGLKSHVTEIEDQYAKKIETQQNADDIKTLQGQATEAAEAIALCAEKSELEKSAEEVKALKGRVTTLENELNTYKAKMSMYYAQETEPEKPVAGTLWLNTKDGTFQYYDGTAWAKVS